MEEYTYTSTHLLGHTGPVTGKLYLYLYTLYCTVVHNISFLSTSASYNCGLYTNPQERDITEIQWKDRGRDSSVSIATRYRLVGPDRDRIPVGARFSASVQTGSGAHPASWTMGTGYFRGVNGRGVALTTHLHLAPRLRKE